MRKPASHPTLFPSLGEVPAPVPKRAPRPQAAKVAAAPQPVKAAVTLKPASAPKAAAAPKPGKAPIKAAAVPQPVKATASIKPPKAVAASRREKTIPVQTLPPAPPVPVRIVTETAGAGGRAWRMSSRYAIAYVRDAALAGELLATDARHLAKTAMAVYYDRKGKAFAWQVRFDAARWDEVVQRLG